ncbi:MAG TPA: M23 family metallopeptidase [Bacteroidota bacterium]|nr:M23 family metallopeptidase [Bacteroidota bacterium]
MAENREHHKTSKNELSIIVVPNGETGKSKNYRIAPWHLVTGLLAAVLLVVSSVLLVLIYTPVGSLVPISNPYLENKYSKELVDLSERMTRVMQQLYELRTYNIKLRQALGENVSVSDSGLVAQQTERQQSSEPTSETVRPEESQAEVAVQPADVAANFHPSIPEGEGTPKIVFPAMMPTEGYTTRGYDPSHGHFGLDIAAKTGSLVTAAADGFVVFAGWTHDDGYQIILSHDGGFLTFYKHNQTLLKPANVFVKRGEPIALLGTSGVTSSGPHVHFEIWKNGTPVDPRLYLLNYNL